jgi:hypothetical protein
MVLSGCASLGSCHITAGQLDQQHITYGLPGPKESIFRIQGIFRGGFEISSLAIAYDGPLDDLQSFYFTDICIGFSEACWKSMDRKTRAKGRFRDSFSNFGLVDAIVQYNSSSYGDCPLGSVTIINLVSARSIPATAAFGTPLHVDIRRGGDDGLTLRFAEALEAAFHYSELLTLIGEKKSGTWVVTIPTNVEWTRIGDRTRMSYRVEVNETGSRRVTEKSGRCWEDDLVGCAKRLADEIETAATSRPEGHP